MIFSWDNLKTFSSKLSSSFLSLCYPSLCLHCKQSRENLHVLCDSCLKQLVFLEREERCHCCFSLSSEPLCMPCLKNKPLYQSLATFDYIGPAGTLIRGLKYENKPYLADGCGAYMAAQLLQMELEIPDLIVPVPISFIRGMFRGYNQSLLLAMSLGKLLNCPVENVLTRRSGGYSQAGRSKKQRLALEGSLFQLKRHANIEGKSILLVDDVMTTGTTLQRSSEALLEGFPEKISAITFCMANG